MKMNTTSVILLLATCLAGVAKDITNAAPEAVPKPAPSGPVEQATPAQAPAPAATPLPEPVAAPAAPTVAPDPAVAPAAPTPAPDPAATPATPTTPATPAPAATPEAGPAPAAAPTAAPADAAAGQNATTTAAAAPSAGTAGTNDTVPLIVIEDVPLTDAIRNLARQSNLNFQFDPRVASSNQPTISIRFENVTAQEALNAVLDNYNLALIRDQ